MEKGGELETSSQEEDHPKSKKTLTVDLRKSLQKFAFVHETDRSRGVTTSNEVKSFSYERPTQVPFWNSTLLLYYFFLYLLLVVVPKPSYKNTH